MNRIRNVLSWSCVWKLPALIALAIVGLDQYTKALILQSDRLVYVPYIEVIPGFFHIVYVTNTGAAWGMFADQTSLLALISLIVLVVMIVQYRSFSEGFWERSVALSLLMGGIAGNLIDRTFRDTGVIDFLSFFYKSYEWPAFNVADSAICTGVAVFLLSSIIRPDNSESQPEVEVESIPAQQP